jgi:hypothetical protein
LAQTTPKSEKVQILTLEIIAEVPVQIMGLKHFVAEMLRDFQYSTVFCDKSEPLSYVKETVFSYYFLKFCNIPEPVN